MPHPRDQHAAIIRLIAAFKLIKAVLLLFIGLGALKLIHHDVHEFAKTIIHHIHGDPDGRYFRGAIGSLSNVSDNKLRVLGIAAFSYSVMYFIEGIGLMFTMQWAEWMAVFTTSGFVPLEVMEIIKPLSAHDASHHVPIVRIIVLLINVAMVVYLIRELMRRRALEPSHLRAAVASPESSS